VNRIRGVAPQVRIGAADASLTSASGVVAVAELVERLGVMGALDEAIGAIKQRERGLSAGGLLVSVAQTQMLSGDFMACLGRRRADVAGEALSVVPTPASRRPRPVWPSGSTGLNCCASRTASPRSSAGRCS